MCTPAAQKTRGALLFTALAALVASTAAHALDNFDQLPSTTYSDILNKGKEDYVEKRYDDAFPLLKQAACAGDKESQWSLGQMYLLGQGVQRDDVTGYSWLSAAAELQPSPYSTAFAKIEQSVDPKQLSVLKSHGDARVDKYGMSATRMSCHQSASRGGHVLDRVVCEPDRVGRTRLIHRCLDSDSATPTKTVP
jgi:TPR repeat protein